MLEGAFSDVLAHTGRTTRKGPCSRTKAFLSCLWENVLLFYLPQVLKHINELFNLLVSKFRCPHEETLRHCLSKMHTKRR